MSILKTCQSEWVSRSHSPNDSSLSHPRSITTKRSGFYGILSLILAVIFIMPQTASAEGPASWAHSMIIPYVVPDRIVIPSIDLDSPIISVKSQIKAQNGQRYREWDTADNVVGWHNLSARLGHPGNTVLAGHSDIYDRVFQNLHHVQLGNEITVSSGGYVRQYVVTDIREIRERGVSLAQRIENGRLISRTTDERITLVTCSRPGASHRLVVIAHPVE